jgi:hypothetical protein
MLSLMPKITNTGVTGVSLLTFAAGRLSPHATPPALLYALSTVGVALVIWDAVGYTVRLVRVRRVRTAAKYASRRSATTPR